MTLDTDYPVLVPTVLGEELVGRCGPLGYGPETVRRLCLGGIRDSGLDTVDPKDRYRRFDRQPKHH